MSSVLKISFWHVVDKSKIYFLIEQFDQDPVGGMSNEQGQSYF